MHNLCCLNFVPYLVELIRYKTVSNETKLTITNFQVMTELPGVDPSSEAVKSVMGNIQKGNKNKKEDDDDDEGGESAAKKPRKDNN